MGNKRMRSKAIKNLQRSSEIKVALVEGSSEKNYSEFLKNHYNSSIKLKILQQSTLKKNFKNQIERYADNEGIDVQELILVYDLENSEEEFATFISSEHLKHKNTYLIQPCIELHFLLHFDTFQWSNNNYYEQASIQKKLVERLPKYKKGASFAWEQYINKEQLELAKQRSLKNFDSFRDKSFSLIVQLIVDHLE